MGVNETSTGHIEVCPKCHGILQFDPYSKSLMCRQCGHTADKTTSVIKPDFEETHNFIALISRMRLINRWSLMRSTFSENIQEHSYMVAVIANTLAIIENAYFGGSIDIGKVVLASLYHDAPEVIIGDLPTPVKYYNEKILGSYKELEDNTIQHIMSMLPSELRSTYEEWFAPSETHIKSLVKAADKLSAYIKCVEETQAGNKEFTQAKATLEEALKRMGEDIKSVGYFMDKFIPGISLSLDELR